MRIEQWFGGALLQVFYQHTLIIYCVCVRTYKMVTKSQFSRNVDRNDYNFHPQLPTPCQSSTLLPFVPIKTPHAIEIVILIIAVHEGFIYFQTWY